MLGCDDLDASSVQLCLVQVRREPCILTGRAPATLSIVGMVNETSLDSTTNTIASVYQSIILDGLNLQSK